MPAETLEELLIEELKDLYSAENQLVKALSVLQRSTFGANCIDMGFGVASLPAEGSIPAPHSDRSCRLVTGDDATLGICRH